MYKSIGYAQRLFETGLRPSDLDDMMLEFDKFLSDDLVCLKIILDYIKTNPSSQLTPNMVKSLKTICIATATQVLIGLPVNQVKTAVPFVKWGTLLVYLEDMLTDLPELGVDGAVALPMFQSFHDRINAFLEDVVQQVEEGYAAAR